MSNPFPSGRDQRRLKTQTASQAAVGQAASLPYLKETTAEAGSFGHGSAFEARSSAAALEGESPYGLPSPESASRKSALGHSLPTPAAGTRFWPQRPQTWRPGRPLQAVHVGPCLYRGGAEQHLIDLVRHLHPERVQLQQSILTNPEYFDARVTSDLGIPVVPGGADEVRRAAEDADVLISWGLTLNDFLTDPVPAVCVYLAHGDAPWTRNMLDGSNRAIDHVIAVSERVRRMTCDGFATTVIWNGIDTARLTTSVPAEMIRRGLGFGPTDFVLGYVGRFAAEKRPWLLIEAVEMLPAEFKVLLVGWGPLQADLLEQANARIPGRFSCLRLDRYLGDAYAAMNAFCLPSDQEGFALVLLEAMHSAVPVIATPVGAVPEFIEDRVSGQIVDGSPAEIAAAARRLRDHPLWARGLAEEGRARADAIGHASRMAVEYETLFERLWLAKRASH